MASLPSSLPPPFWQTIVLQILRLAVRVALKAGRCTASTLLHLLRVALFRELEAHGMSQAQMALVLGISPSAVKGWASASTKLNEPLPSSTSQESMLQGVTMRLRQGPALRSELAGCAPQGYEFDAVSVLLHLLEEKQFVQIKAGPRGSDDPTVEWVARSTVDWEHLPGELEVLHAVALRVLPELGGRAHTQTQLARLPSLAEVSPAELGRCLQFLEKVGLITFREVGRHRSRAYRLRGELVSMLGPDPAAQVRLGHVDLFDKLGLYLSGALESPGDPAVGQRSLIATLSAKQLAEFIPEHRTWVLERLKELGREAPEHGPRAVILWAMAPVVESTAPSHHSSR